MNKIYKVIWNATLCTWVAVSELAKGKTKSSKVTKIVGAATVAAMSFAPAMAAPQLPLDASGNLNIGDGNVVTTINSYVFGANNTVNGERNVVSGAMNTTSHNLATAIGVQNNVSGFKSTAIGQNNEVKGQGSIVTGHDNKTSAVSYDTVVQGAWNNVDGDRNVVSGAYNTTSAHRATAIGMQNEVSGYRGTAIGQNNVVTEGRALALGASNRSQGESSVAIGNISAALGDSTIAIGHQAQTANGVERAIALGADSRANNADDIALGSQAVTAKAIGTAGVTLNGTNYAFAGKTPIGTLSIGRADFERTITNVAAGRVSATSTDGVNGSQLHATNLALVDLNAGAVKYDRKSDGSVNKDNITLEGAISTDGGVTGGTKITNLAQGAVNKDSTDAVNGSQLNSSAQSVGDLIGGGVTNVGGAVTGPFTANGTDYNNIAEAIEGESAAAKTEVEEGKNISVTSTTGTDGQTIYTVATADEVEFDKVTVGNTTITTDGLTIVGGPSITTAGINAGGKKVTNVADGEIAEDSTDAVNGSQLYALGDNITNIFGGNANYANNQIIWTNIGGTGKDTIDEAIQYVNNQATNANQGWKVITDSGTAATSTVKPGDIVNIKGDTASGVTVTNSGNDITVGLGDQITVGTGANAVSIDGNGGTIQVGDINIDGTTNTITAGKVSLNGDSGTVNGLTNITWNPADIVSGQAATEDQLKQVADNAAQAAAAAKSTVTEGENVTVTQSKNADGSTNYQVATKKDVTFDSVTSGSVSADKVIVGNVVIDQAGISAGGNKVSNLADGTISSTSKDAINGSQLHASNTNIYNYLGGGANYETNTGPTYNVGGGSHNNVGDALDALDDRDTQLDNKITNLGDQLQQAFYTTNERIDGVEKRANAGIAAAMALETAPYVAGKWTYAAATAYHGGENAVGVTLRKTADNGRWSLTGGIAAASEGDPSFRIGISGVID